MHMTRLFAASAVAILTIGCAANQAGRPPAVVQHPSDAAQCSDCLVYAVYQHTASEVIIIVGRSRDIPEGWEPSASDLLSMKTFRGNAQGVGPGVLIDISEMDMIRVRGMHPASQHPCLLNITESLNQEFRDKKGRWHQLIKPFLD